MTTSAHTIILKPGESFSLPAGGDLTFVSDPAGIDSDCVDIPTTTYKCGFFFVNMDSTGLTLNSMDEETTFIRQIRVGDNRYTINEFLLFGQNSGSLNTIANFNSHITDQALFSFTGLSRTILAERQYISIYFTVPENLFDDTAMVLDNRSSRQVYEPLEAVCGEYPTHTDTDVDYND